MYYLFSIESVFAWFNKAVPSLISVIMWYFAATKQFVIKGAWSNKSSEYSTSLAQHWSNFFSGMSRRSTQF